jgi:hypothetical protein
MMLPLLLLGSAFAAAPDDGHGEAGEWHVSLYADDHWDYSTKINSEAEVSKLVCGRSGS